MCLSLSLSLLPLLSFFTITICTLSHVHTIIPTHAQHLIPQSHTRTHAHTLTHQCQSCGPKTCLQKHTHARTHNHSHTHTHTHAHTPVSKLWTNGMPPQTHTCTHAQPLTHTRTHAHPPTSVKAVDQWHASRPIHELGLGVPGPSLEALRV